MLPRAVAELLPHHLRANILALSRFAHAPVLLPVKANGYGHGLRLAVEATRDLACVWGFAVATPTEAVDAVEASGGKPVVLLTPFAAEEGAELAALGVRLTVSSLQDAASLPEGARVHLKVNTGMNRLGVWWEDAADVVAALAESGRLEGVMTHFSRADEPDLSHAREQLRRFQAVVADVPTGVLRHASNSGALLSFGPSAAFDLVRPGIASYGFPAETHLSNVVPLRPALRVRARVTHVQTVRAGEEVSYGGLWRAPRETRVATVGMGYADGLPRRASLKARVIVRGEPRTVLGRICMDQCMVDVDGLDVRPGEWVEVFGSDLLTAEAWAEAAGTNVYEVLTRLGERVRREVAPLPVRP
ncbi:alanine racemase [Deinococcus yavapaiensis]|uniref:Alanine racemase n=1 Tax=Deinococcus yavapaiensis KR-236 TaxID=694435 RepID=A0A318SQQ9_9DEIO|nr:alanine racemase [Deinococcus yavapaiensis]PYE55213.1 alanine racemase [Deinococcus yavapaiensis KR-236]